MPADEDIAPVPQRSGLFRAVQAVLELAVVGYLVHYFVAHGGDFGLAVRMGLAQAAAVTALIVASTLIRAWQLFYLIDSLAGRLPFGDSLALTTGCSLLNHLPMSAGTVLKAVILKRNSGLLYAHFLALTAGQVLATFLAGGLLGLVVLALPSALGLAQRWVLMAAFGGVLAACAASFYIPVAAAGPGGGWLARSIRSFLVGLQVIRRRRGSLLVLTATTLLMLVSAAARFWICFRVLNVDVSFIGSGVFAIIATFLTLVNITPAGLGIREAAVGMVAAFTGEGFAAGVLAAGIERVFTMAFFLVTGSISLVVLRRRKVI